MQFCVEIRLLPNSEWIRFKMKPLKRKKNLLGTYFKYILCTELVLELLLMLSGKFCYNFPCTDEQRLEYDNCHHLCQCSPRISIVYLFSALVQLSLLVKGASQRCPIKICLSLGWAIIKIGKVVAELCRPFQESCENSYRSYHFVWMLDTICIVQWKMLLKALTA